VIARAQKSPLRDAALLAYLNGLEIQDEYLFTDPGVIADCQLPGKVDVHARFDNDSFSDARAEATQHDSFNRVGNGQRREKQQAFAQIPNRLDPKWSPAIQPFARIKKIITHAQHIFLRCGSGFG